MLFFYREASMITDPTRASVTPPTIAVRHAGLADLAALAPLFDLYRQFYGQQSDVGAATAFLRQRLEARDSVLLIAEADGAALGFVQLYPTFSSVSMARKFVLNDLYVLQAGRKRGIGKALLDGAAAHARAAGACAMSLATLLSNDTAQALYRANGWEPDELFRQFNLHLRR